MDGTSPSTVDAYVLATPVVVTLADGAEAGPKPKLLNAVTVNVYAAAPWRPDRVALVAVPPTPTEFSDGTPLRFAVTRYPVTGDPAPAVDAVQLTIAWLALGVAATPPGAVGGPLPLARK